MRGWDIFKKDAKHDVLLHAVDKRDLDTIAKHCADLRATGQVSTPDGDKLCMSADGFTIQAWCDAKGITWKEFFRDQKLQTRFIEDPDNAAFRVWTGRL